MKKPEPAPSDVVDIFNNVREKHHQKRLNGADIAVLFTEEKPFKKNRFNWGRVKKCSPETNALLGGNGRYDFVISVPTDGWSFLDTRQREAWADLLLTRCTVEYEPEMDGPPPDEASAEDAEGGEGKKRKKKPKPVKDPLGRIKYTDRPKYDEDGDPKWSVDPLDVQTVTDNVSRYGAWFPDFKELGDALRSKAAA